MNLSWIPVLHQLRSVGWLYSESRMLHLWLEILFRVQRSRDTYPVKGDPVALAPGQFVASTRKLAAAISVDKDTVGRYLKILETQKWIERKIMGNLTLYTVLVMEHIPEFTIREGDTATENLRTVGDTLSDTSSDTVGDIYYSNKNNKKNNSSPTHVREEEIFERFLEDDEALTQLAHALHCRASRLKTIYPDFVQECRVKEKEHGTMLEIKDHFFNWARARLNREKQNGSANTNKSRGGAKGNQRGRRTPLEPGCGLIED